jgi:hypothetical protein
MAFQLYKDLHVELDRHLADVGLRPRIRFMGGDLRIEKQRDWFAFLAKELSGLLQAYSIHVYWNYFEPDHELHGIESRLSGVRGISDGLGPGQKPVFVTECGVRGRAPEGGKADPGFYENPSTPMASTNINARSSTRGSRSVPRCSATARRSNGTPISGCTTHTRRPARSSGAPVTAGPCSPPTGCCAG